MAVPPAGPSGEAPIFSDNRRSWRAGCAGQNPAAPSVDVDSDFRVVGDLVADADVLVEEDRVEACAAGEDVEIAVVEDVGVVEGDRAGADGGEERVDAVERGGSCDEEVVALVADDAVC